MSKDAFPIITVSDIERASRFYGQLGFVQTYQFPAEGAAVFVSLERYGSKVGLALRSDAEQEPFNFWVYVDDVDATAMSLSESSAEIALGPADQPWGERIAQVRDPDGNLVTLGAAIVPD